MLSQRGFSAIVGRDFPGYGRGRGGLFCHGQEVFSSLPRFVDGGISVFETRCFLNDKTMPVVLRRAECEEKT